MVSSTIAQILASFFGRRSERHRARPTRDRSLPACIQQLDARRMLSGGSVTVASLPAAHSVLPVTHATIVNPAVTTAPFVTTNPTSQTLKAGQTAVFTAAATGNPAPKGQWQVSTNGGVSYTNLAGQVNTTLNVLVTSVMNNYRYREVFTNTWGSATTLAATLTVGVPPQLTKNPVSQTVVNGTSVTFTASASGNPAPSIQWIVSTNGGSTYTPIPGATSSSLTFIATAAQNGYYYRATLTNAVGLVQTAAAKLTVIAPPVTASLVRDFGDGKITPAAVVTPLGATAGGRSLFWITSQSTGDLQLWSTAGATDLTMMLHDFGNFTGPKAVIGAAHGYLFIGMGGSQTSNAQVWRTDGTATGTIVVQTYVNSFLTVLNPVNGIGLYGVVDSATHLATIYGVNTAGAPFVPAVIGTAGNVGVTTFAGASPIQSLGNVNGTAAGTALFSVTIYNGTVGPIGVQMWSTNGTNGTTLVRYFNTASTSLSNVGTVNGVALIRLLRGNDNQLWETNGTAAGTTLLSDFASGVISSLGTSGTGYALLAISFSGPNGLPTDTQLWSTNGTASGTIRVRSYGAVTLSPLGIVYGAVEFYLTNAATSDNQIWYSYGQTSTTDLVQDFTNSIFTPLSTVNGVVTIGIQTNGASPTQSIWGISGRPSNLALIANFAGNTTLSYVATVNGVTMFTVTKPDGFFTDSQVWRTDGTTANTVLIRDFGEYSSFVYEGYVNGVALIGIFDSVIIRGQLYGVHGL